ncbi:hypothetical protein H5410_037937 [Solanum commersonii]|uniref:Uncharacterized protein n=1 Tax=Solanum commersonii TaxID=4109 RepID=A0A9J5Y8M3_SOLCO|nr:hypothetical protein H5410_037937 [Solanum commersonii]
MTTVQPTPVTLLLHIENDQKRTAATQTRRHTQQRDRARLLEIKLVFVAVETHLLLLIPSLLAAHRKAHVYIFGFSANTVD